MSATNIDRARFIVRLAGLGYPPALALRVGLTPPFTVHKTVEDDGSRPGLELHAAVEGHFGNVVRIVAPHLVEPSNGGAW